MDLNELYKLREELDILNYPNLDDLKILLEKVIQEKEARKAAEEVRKAIEEAEMPPSDCKAFLVWRGGVKWTKDEMNKWRKEEEKEEEEEANWHN